MKPDTKYTYSAMGFMTIHDLKYCDCKSSRLRDPSANCSYSFFYNLDVEDETRHKIHILRHGFQLTIHDLKHCDLQIMKVARPMAEFILFQRVCLVHSGSML